MALLTKKPALTPEELKIPYSKYYNLELEGPEQFVWQILSKGPMDPSDALPVDRRFEGVDPVSYRDVELGYCIMEDGSGYMTHYTYLPNIPAAMVNWWFQWFTFKTPNMPEGQGNLRYKIWCPPDHFDHGFINPEKPEEGVYLHESLDFGEGDPRHYAQRRSLDPSLATLPPKMDAAMKKAGCSYGFGVNSTEGITGRVSFQMTRPKGAGCELFGRTWYGFVVRDGKIVRDYSGTQANEEKMRKTILHNAVEMRHLSRLLPPLYAEYGTKPIDEDF